MRTVDKVLVVAPAFHQTLWEIQLLFHSAKAAGQNASDIVWLSHGGGPADVKYAEELAERVGVSYHHYDDARELQAYPTSIRPWLIARYLDEDPERCARTYLYVDSDVVINTLPDLDAITGPPGADRRVWWGSDASSYAALRLLSRKERAFVEEVVGAEHASTFFHAIPGVQWILDRPTPQVFYDIYTACERVYSALQSLDHGERADPWFTDIWVTPAVAAAHGIDCKMSADLDFSLADDPYMAFTGRSFYHNSGVSQQHAHEIGAFAKRDWILASPFGRTHVLSPLYASYGYVEYMKNIDPQTSIIDIELPTVAYGSLWTRGN